MECQLEHMTVHYETIGVLVYLAFPDPIRSSLLPLGHEWWQRAFLRASTGGYLWGTIRRH